MFGMFTSDYASVYFTDAVCTVCTHHVYTYTPHMLV